MTSTRRTITLVLSILGLLALPAVASANVNGKLDKAANALDAAVAAAEDRGDAAAFKANMRAAHKYTAKAERKARKAKGKVKKAKLLRKVARQYDANLNEYADLIALVPPSLQLPVVDAIGLSAEARERVVAFLVRIAEKLPEPARTAVLDAIAKFETDGDIMALFEALVSEDVTDPVKQHLLDKIEMITGHVSDVLESLKGLTGMLPPQAAGVVNQAISMIQGHLGELSTMIQEIFDGFGFGGGNGGGWFGGGFGLGSICNLLAGCPNPIPIPFCD